MGGVAEGLRARGREGFWEGSVEGSVVVQGSGGGILLFEGEGF